MNTNFDHLLQSAQEYQREGKLAEAIQLYDQLIEMKSNLADLRYKRANALFRLYRWDEAIAGYDQTIALDSRHAKAFCNRGVALERLGKKLEALESYDRAVDLNPDDSLAYFNRGVILKDLAQLQQALANYERAVELNPEYAEAWVNRGNILQELGRHEEAIASCDRAIAINPALVPAFKTRGSSLHSLQRYEAAIDSYDRAISLDAQSPYLLGMRRYAQMHLCDWNGISSDKEDFCNALKRGQSACTPFMLLALIDSPALLRTAAETWVRDNCPPATVGECRIRAKSERLHIGYFSPDFRNHPISVLAAQVFESHDRSKCEVTAFALGPKANDDMRTRLERAFDQFIDVSDESDSQIVALARAAGIDIAVDLAGFTEHSRTGIFAMRAAPVQVNYLGYAGTMGAPYMDYLIGDQMVIPESHRGYYTEKIVYLPHCYLPNDSTRRIAKTTYRREQLGLPSKGFVFCCFNNNFKLTPEVFDRWMRILQRIEHSVLWLSRGNAGAVANLHEEARRIGVDTARIIFAERFASAAEHLARLRAADLFLDTHPYNAHATAVDALSAGLPLLTYAGRSFAGRVGASLLRTLDLPELIAETPEHYEQIALQLATDAPRLAAIRQKLAERLSEGAQFDGRHLAQHLETAYFAMYEEHRTQRPA